MGKYLLGIRWVPWHGMHVGSVREGADPCSPDYQHMSAPEQNVKKVILGQGAEASKAKHLAPIDCRILGQLPNLVAHCCVTKYDDDSARETGWITIGTRGAAWVVTVKEPDAGAKMVLAGNTLDDAMCLADLMLGSEDAPWEIDPFLQRQKKKNKKGS